MQSLRFNMSATRVFDENLAPSLGRIGILEPSDDGRGERPIALEVVAGEAGLGEVYVGGAVVPRGFSLVPEIGPVEHDSGLTAEHDPWV